MLSRRQFLGAGATATAAFSVRDVQAADARLSAVKLCFAADAKSLRKITPVPLDPSEPARVVVEFRKQSIGSSCYLSVAVDLEGETHLLPVAVWNTNPYELRAAREFLGLPAFTGSIKHSGGTFGLHSAKAELFQVSLSTDAEFTPAPDRLPSLSYRYLLHPDWPDGPLDPSAPVELWRLSDDSITAWEALPIDAATITGSFLGMFSRLGVSEIVSVSVRRQPLEAAQPAPEFVKTVEPRAFASYAFRNYPADSLGLVPTTSSKLSTQAEPGQLEAYRGRKECAVEGVTIIEVEGTIDREKHAALLPPGCQAILRPSLRLLAVRGFEDPSLDEAWLLAFCLLDNRAVWYAVSHFKPTIAGSEFGREVFGYPTKSGQVDSFVTPVGFGATLRRHGRTLLHTEGSFEGFSTGTSLAQIEIATLRLRPEFHDTPRSGELLIQPWYYQGLRKRVAPRSLRFEFPVPPEGSAKTELDAWHEFGHARIATVSVIDSAAIQRMPAQAVAPVRDIDQYYRDRCDGALPWEPIPSLAAETRRT
jgi:hypothetical protein